jgi:cytosine/creatinine deaminase
MRLEDPMEHAFAQACIGRQEGGIPIGSVLTRGGVVIGEGRNRRVQQNDPILHAEIDCLQHAGRIGSYRDTVLYSTLMPCFLCAGAVVQFGIPHVIVGEDINFSGSADFLMEHGVKVEVLQDQRCIQLMADFIANNPALWNEDIGEDTDAVHA